MWKRHKHQHSARQQQNWRCGSSWRKPCCRSVALVCCVPERFPVSKECLCCNIVSCITDSSSKTTPTRDAFHPKPIQHRVYLPAWFGARCGLHNQGSEDSASTRCIQMLAVPNGLYSCMEVGEESNKRWVLWWGNKKHMSPDLLR